MSFSVPVYSKKNSITYTISKQEAANLSGLFSFTFYLRADSAETKETTPKQSNLYLNGLIQYLKILNINDIQGNPFKNWKILIYTDNFTIEKIFSNIELLELRKKGGKKLGLYDQEDFDLYNRLLYEPDPINTSATTTISSSMSSSGPEPTFYEKNPNSQIIFGIVDWERHQRRAGRKQINGTALRPFRSRAPFDFQNSIICIRDADTLFDESLKRASIFNDEFTNKLYDWEKAFLSIITDEKFPNPSLIVGSGEIYNPDKGVGVKDLYKKSWHGNEVYNIEAPFGVFAGFINVLPGLNIYQNPTAWDNFIDYINERSFRTNRSHYPILTFYNETGNANNTQLPNEGTENYNALKQKFNTNKTRRISNMTNRTMKRQNLTQNDKTNFITKSTARIQKNWNEKWEPYYEFSNNADIHRIGRDEQLYLFIFMPQAIDNLIFFDVHLDDLTPPTGLNLQFHQERLEEYTKALEAIMTPVKKLKNTAKIQKTNKNNTSRKNTREINIYQNRYLKRKMSPGKKANVGPTTNEPMPNTETTITSMTTTKPNKVENNI